MFVTHKAHEDLARTIARELAGGDAYAYFTEAARIPCVECKAEDLESNLTITSTGPLYDLAWWISPADAKRDPHNELYWSMRGVAGQRATVRPGGFLTSTKLAPGSYVVEFSARNGSWVEAIEIGSGRFPVVMRDGKNFEVGH